MQQEEQNLKSQITANGDGSYSNVNTIQDFTGTSDFANMSAADKQKYGLTDEDTKRLSSKPPQFLSGSDDEVKAKLTKMAQAKAKADGIDLNATDDKTKQYKAQMETKINKYVAANKANNDLYMNFQYQANLLGANSKNETTKPEGVPSYTKPPKQEEQQEKKVLSAADKAALDGGGKISDKLNKELTSIGRKAYQAAVKNGSADPEKEARIAVRQELSSRGAGVSALVNFNTGQLGKFSEVDKPDNSTPAQRTTGNQPPASRTPSEHTTSGSGNKDISKMSKEDLNNEIQRLNQENTALREKLMQGDQSAAAKIKENVKLSNQYVAKLAELQNQEIS